MPLSTKNNFETYPKLCAAFLEHAPIDAYHTPELIADELALNRYLLYHCPDYRAELSSIPATEYAAREALKSRYPRPPVWPWLTH
eukprot:272362-Prymnesium_polylepis.1